MEISSILFSIAGVLLISAGVVSALKQRENTKNCAVMIGTVVEHHMSWSSLFGRNMFEIRVAFHDENGTLHLSILNLTMNPPLGFFRKGARIPIFFNPSKPDVVYTTHWFYSYGLYALCSCVGLILLLNGIWGYDWSGLFNYR